VSSGLGGEQGLKYNFQGGGTVQLSGPPVCSRAPVHFLGPCFNSGLANYQTSTECIIKHDFRVVFFCNFVKKTFNSVNL